MSINTPSVPESARAPKVSSSTVELRAEPTPPSTLRLNLMRSGYLLMGLGLMVFRWPLLVQAVSMPAKESALLCILVAMSLLAFLGLKYPIAMLPILLFEVAWKVIWFAVVALPHLIANDMNDDTQQLLFSVLFGIAILAVTPWGYVWKCYVLARGDRWVRSA